MMARYGRARTLNKLAFNWIRWRFLAPGEARIVRDSFFPRAKSPTYEREVYTVVVENINDARCVEFLRAERPDTIAVCGTSVLRPEVFTLASRGTVNIHTGITPEYRSADPIFWALYNLEPEKVGVTIHFIDRGIDSGPVIHQEPVPVYAEDSLASIYVRCIRRGAELYSLALREIAEGSVRTLEKPGVASRAYLSVDLGIVQYFQFLLRFRRLAARFPRQGLDLVAPTSGDDA
jgi:methionyl-tRNA formyltransferase